MDYSDHRDIDSFIKYQNSMSRDKKAKMHKTDGGYGSGHSMKNTKKKKNYSKKGYM